MKQTSWKCTRQQNKDGNTPLHLCAKLNKLQCMQCMLTGYDIAANKCHLSSRQASHNRHVLESASLKR